MKRIQISRDERSKMATRIITCAYSSTSTLRGTKVKSTDAFLVDKNLSKKNLHFCTFKEGSAGQVVQGR